jgi:hypothetical protein
MAVNMNVSPLSCDNVFFVRGVSTLPPSTRALPFCLLNAISMVKAKLSRYRTGQALGVPGG